MGGLLQAAYQRLQMRVAFAVDSLRGHTGAAGQDTPYINLQATFWAES